MNAEAALAAGQSRRLRSRDRQRQIVRVASELLAQRGVDHVRMPEVAALAGVTRAVVYRFFPSRQALLGAVLEEFRRDLEERFSERSALLRGAKVTDAIVQSFVMACCDAIDATGAGGFILLNMDGPDPELAALSRRTREALNRPWLARVANVTRAQAPMLSAVSAMALASSRAVLMLYVEKRISREQAALALARGTRALLVEFRG